MREKTKLKLISLVVVLVVMVLLPVGNVKASLQANPNTHYKKIDLPTNWMSNIRNMEKTGEAMGLSETLNEDLTSSSDSNGIDVHMMKSTEYGAIAILSASGYGNPKKLQDSDEKTTTGNKTGVYFSGTNWEWVAGGLQTSFGGVNSRYYDVYTNDKNSAKVGDALGNVTTTNQGCAGWHSAPSGWISNTFYYFVRGNGGLFSFNGNVPTSTLVGTGGSRGVAICGQGL